jgi:hypothetical protein
MNPFPLRPTFKCNTEGYFADIENKYEKSFNETYIYETQPYLLFDDSCQIYHVCQSSSHSNIQFVRIIELFILFLKFIYLFPK